MDQKHKYIWRHMKYSKVYMVQQKCVLFAQGIQVKVAISQKQNKLSTCTLYSSPWAFNVYLRF